jgi:deoxyguanosine kinase
MHSHIAIEGPIGVGKTTLARSFQQKLGTQAVLDDFENPFLEDFYRERPGAAFRAQLHFLISRFRQQQEIETMKREAKPLVTDYLFAKDKIYAYLNLDDQEISIYDRYFDTLAGYVSAPDLVVYLKAPREVLLERVARRKVRFESRIAEDYIDELIKAYDHFFYHYQETPLLIVNTAEIDFVQNEDDLKGLLHRIANSRFHGVQYYNPLRRKK